jgi:hypothetical protein
MVSHDDTIMASSKADTFAVSAIALIQSESIRTWARSAHNLPIIQQMAAETLAKNPKATLEDFACYLTLVAMG